jgi:hypothetical protein
MQTRATCLYRLLTHTNKSVLKIDKLLFAWFCFIVICFDEAHLECQCNSRSYMPTDSTTTCLLWLPSRAL